MNKTGTINGSNLLLKVKGKAAGHCTSHTLTFTMETKDVAVKPVAAAGIRNGKWTEKLPGKKSVSIKGEGLRVYDEMEGGFKTLLSLFDAAEPIEVEAYERGEAGTEGAEPYAKGDFIITSLEENAPAEDDATYSIQLDNAGAVDIAPDKLTGETGE